MAAPGRTILTSYLSETVNRSCTQVSFGRQVTPEKLITLNNPPQVQRGRLPGSLLRGTRQSHARSQKLLCDVGGATKLPRNNS